MSEHVGHLSPEKIEQRFAAVARSKTFKNILDAHSLGTKRVLDIGCSYGEFLAHFGPGSVGLTIIRDEAEYGTKKGLTIKVANAEERLPFVADEKFDIIFANNILEHLYSPHAFLVRMRSLLREGGSIIVGVPCIPRIPLLMRFRKFRGSLAGNHINFFMKDTLQKTVERAGWLVHSTRSYHAASVVMDRAFDLISPHFYVNAVPDPAFGYANKRKAEVEHYTTIEVPTLS